MTNYYEEVSENKVIFAGTNTLNLNDNNLYNILLKSYNNRAINSHPTIASEITPKYNIPIIQQIYLDLVNTKSKINIVGVEIDFSSDLWDFTSKHKSGKLIGLYRYNFGEENQFIRISEYHKILLKLYVIYLITEYGLHTSMNNVKFQKTKSLIKYMYQNNIILLDEISIQQYKDFLSQYNTNYPTMIKHRRFIQNFITFYSMIANDVYTKELNDWFNDIDTDIITATQIQNKSPLLPTSFYSKYSSLLEKTVFDEEEESWMRGYCGLLYIGTQTGLRVSELAILRVQDLEEIQFRDKKIGILKYRSIKSARGKTNIYDLGETNASLKVRLVFNKLIDLFEEARKKHKLDFLVPRRNPEAIKNIKMNIDAIILSQASKRVCIRYNKELKIKNTPDFESFSGCVEYEGDKIFDFVSNDFAHRYGLEVGDRLCYPHIKQFRVYVASELRERGIDDRTTAHLFNHHSIEMYGYYSRPKHSIQEDIDFSKEIVKDIVKDETKILGPKGIALHNKIDEIIASNNFNVEKDLDSIINKVCNEMPIRAKLGGFCIKSNPRRECRHDAKTDEFMCAYGCCPNQCHMYFMLPVTYQKITDVMKVYEYNIEANYTNAADKEGHKLMAIISNEFESEMSETRKEIDKKGIEAIVLAHKEMESVIYILDEIEMEVISWKRKLKENQLKTS